MCSLNQLCFSSISEAIADSIFTHVASHFPLLALHPNRLPFRFLVSFEGSSGLGGLRQTGTY